MSAYAQGSISSVSLVGPASAPIKIQILDGGAFFSEFVGAESIAADGTPYFQLLQPGTKGARFGVLMEYMPMSVFAAVKAAIETALGTQTPFNITLADDVHSINVSCMPDYSSGNWLSYPSGRLNGTYLKDVTMRFIATA